MLNITHSGKYISKQQCDITSHLLGGYCQKEICVGENEEKEEPLYTTGGGVNWFSHCGKQFGGSSKIKSRNTIWSSNPTSGHISKENKSRILERYLHTHVHCSVIYSNQDVETMCLLTY